MKFYDEWSKSFKFKNNNSTLFIIRGLPGSGKSEFGMNLFRDKGIIYIEPDQFITKAGEYNYSIDNYLDATLKCKWFIINNIQSMDIAIGDVFPRLIDVKDLIALLPIRSNYEVIDLPKLKFNESFNRNVHNVNKFDLLNMINDWEDWIN